MTYLNKGDKVLVPDPGYPTYQTAVKLAGGKCIPYKLSAKNNYQPDFKKLEKSGLKKVKLLSPDPKPIEEAMEIIGCEDHMYLADCIRNQKMPEGLVAE